MLPYLGLQGGGATLDEIAEILFAGQLYELIFNFNYCNNLDSMLSLFPRFPE